MQIIEINHSGQVLYTQLADSQLVEALQDKHYYLTKYSNTLSKLITIYPPLSSLILQPSSQVGIYQLSVWYTSPEIVMRFQGNTLWLVGENLYPVQADYSGLVLQLPSYSTGMTLSGLFYQVPAAQLVKQYQAIIRWLQDENIQRLTYHVAASQIQVNTTTQEIYLNVAGNIFEQLKNYRSLSGNNELIPYKRIIDLGSINNGVFIYP